MTKIRNLIRKFLDAIRCSVIHFIKRDDPVFDTMLDRTFKIAGIIVFLSVVIDKIIFNRPFDLATIAMLIATFYGVFKFTSKK